jgi:NADH-quinone oxidoreductase subunit I
MDQVFELAREDRRMLLQLKDLAKSNAYFHQIHPGEAAAVDEARAEEKRKAQAKRATAAAPATPAIL